MAFGNEIGTICAHLGLDSHAVMEIFFADTKLNISDAYLRPGFAFGGSCLPKDVRALMHTARQNDLEIPVIANIMVSNESQIRRVIDMIVSTGKRRVGLYGLSFKSGTDDLRREPARRAGGTPRGQGLRHPCPRRERHAVVDRGCVTATTSPSICAHRRAADPVGLRRDVDHGE